MPTGIYEHPKQCGFQKGHKIHLGKHHSDSAKEKMSLSRTGKTGENANNWQGGNSYNSMHKWIRSELGEPEICEHCKKEGLKSHQIHWSNKSHTYKKDINDWQRLCSSCHSKYDIEKGFIDVSKFNFTGKHHTKETIQKIKETIKLSWRNQFAQAKELSNIC